MDQEDLQTSDSGSSLDDSKVSFETESPIATEHGCKHYERRCIFVSPCCGKQFPCRICHDEEITSHNLDRHIVQEIVCALCTHRQTISNKCVSCDISFGKYFCSICRMFDDREKGQFHCDGCGICRVGGRDNFFHCDKCGLCLPNSIMQSHKCIEKSSRNNCPVCLEDLHTSRNRSHVPKCGHLLHTKCYQMMLRMGVFRCPICGVSLENMDAYWKSLDEEIQAMPMPEEYADHKMWTLCKDCHKVSHVKFHVLGMKCIACGSYNTCGSGAPSPQETEV